MNYRTLTAWTSDEDDNLRRMWTAGLSATAIANALAGRTRNAVLGRAHRLGIANRGSPPSLRPRVVNPAVRAPKPAPAPTTWTAVVADIPGRPCWRCGAARGCGHRT